MGAINPQAFDHGDAFNKAYIGMGNYLLGKQKQEADLTQQQFENTLRTKADARDERKITSSLETERLTQEELKYERKRKEEDDAPYQTYLKGNSPERDLELLSAQEATKRPDRNALDALNRVHVGSSILPDDATEFPKAAAAGKYLYDIVGRIGELPNGKTYKLKPQDDPDGFAAIGYLLGRENNVSDITYVSKPIPGAGDYEITKIVNGKPVTEKISAEVLRNKAASAVNAAALAQKTLSNATPEDLEYLKSGKARIVKTREEFAAERKKTFEREDNAKQSKLIIQNLDKLREPDPVDSNGKPIIGKRNEWNDRIDLVKQAAESGVAPESILNMHNNLIIDRAAKSETEDGARTAISMFMKSNIKGNEQYIKELKANFNDDGSPKVGGKFSSSRDVKDVVASIMTLNAANWRNEQDNLSKERVSKALHDNTYKNYDIQSRSAKMLAARIAAAKTGKPDPTTGKIMNPEGVAELEQQLAQQNTILTQKFPTLHNPVVFGLKKSTATLADYSDAIVTDLRAAQENNMRSLNDKKVKRVPLKTAKDYAEDLVRDNGLDPVTALKVSTEALKGFDNLGKGNLSKKSTWNKALGSYSAQAGPPVPSYKSEEPPAGAVAQQRGRDGKMYYVDAQGNLIQ